ncbi:MAG: DUF3048 domain-containing protein [Actinomycetes bacterium]
MSTRPRSRRDLFALGAAAVGVWSAAACSPSGPKGAATPSPRGTTTGTTSSASPSEPLRAPLTGVAVTDAAALAHPAVGIKISDVPQAHPQTGVDRADIVFVEPIGVAYTRLGAVFHSDIPDLVGPVRSVRVADAALMGPLGGVLGDAMGAPGVLDYVHGVADLEDLGTLRVTGSGAYIVDGRRPSPDDVFAKPSVLLHLATRTAPPRPYFLHSDDASSSSTSKGGPALGVEVGYGPGFVVRWDYDAASGRYLRREPWGPHVATDGRQVSAVNVLVLEVEPYVQQVPGGGTPALRLVGAGGGLTALGGGRAVTGTWRKEGVNDPFQLETTPGFPLRLAPGNTWVELPAPGATTRLQGGG